MVAGVTPTESRGVGRRFQPEPSGSSSGTSRIADFVSARFEHAADDCAPKLGVVDVPSPVTRRTSSSSQPRGAHFGAGAREERSGRRGCHGAINGDGEVRGSARTRSLFTRHCRTSMSGSQSACRPQRQQHALAKLRVQKLPVAPALTAVRLGPPFCWRRPVAGLLGALGGALPDLRVHGVRVSRGGRRCARKGEKCRRRAIHPPTGNPPADRASVNSRRGSATRAAVSEVVPVPRELALCGESTMKIGPTQTAPHRLARRHVCRPLFVAEMARAPDLLAAT